MRRIGIFGSSGFAREVGDIVTALGHKPLFVVRDRVELERWSWPDDVVLETDLHSLDSTEFTIGVGDNRVRERIATRYANELHFCNLIHPSATFGVRQREAIDAQRGIIVCSGVRFTNGIEVGDFSIFNLNATVGHDCTIEAFVNVSPGASISGNVHLARRAWIGTGATVIQGKTDRKLRIGEDATIGAGAVVTRDCVAAAVYVGVPARKRRDGFVTMGS